MTAVKTSFEAIEQIAANLLYKHQVNSPDVPIQQLAEKEGLLLLSYDFGENVSGVLLIKDRKGTIGYSSRDSKVRRRFTIAHELGHYFLHWLNEKNPKSEDIFVDKDFIVKFRNSEHAYSEHEYRHEQEANAFAAAILMPSFLLKAEVAKPEYLNLAETEVITKLAKTFDVSVPAMTFRLSNLNFLVSY